MPAFPLSVPLIIASRPTHPSIAHLTIYLEDFDGESRETAGGSVLNEFAVRFHRGWQRDVALYFGLQPAEIILTPFGGPAVRWNQYTRLKGIPCWGHVAETLLRPFQRNDAPLCQSSV